CIAVGFGARGFCCADGTACPALVLDNQGLAELLAHALRYDAGNDVGRPTRGKWNNDANGLRGVIGSLCNASAEQGRHTSSNGQRCEFFMKCCHVLVSL